MNDTRMNERVDGQHDLADTTSWARFVLPPLPLSSGGSGGRGWAAVVRLAALASSPAPAFWVRLVQAFAGRASASHGGHRGHRRHCSFEGGVCVCERV